MMGERGVWVVHADAVLIQRWKSKDGKYHTAIFDPKKRKLATGKVVKIQRGKIVKEFDDE